MAHPFLPSKSRFALMEKVTYPQRGKLRRLIRLGLFQSCDNFTGARRFAFVKVWPVQLNPDLDRTMMRVLQKVVAT